MCGPLITGQVQVNGRWSESGPVFGHELEDVVVMAREVQVTIAEGVEVACSSESLTGPGAGAFTGVMGEDDGASRSSLNFA